MDQMLQDPDSGYHICIGILYMIYRIRKSDMLKEVSAAVSYHRVAVLNLCFGDLDTVCLYPEGMHGRNKISAARSDIKILNISFSCSVFLQAVDKEPGLGNIDHVHPPVIVLLILH